MEIFVKLCTIMVMDVLASGMWTNIASRSGLVHVKLGALTTAESGPLEFVSVFAGWLL